MTTSAQIDLAHLANELQLPVEKVHRTLELLDDGNTVPFITRFRKDQTGGLNEEQVQRIQREAAKERLLAERKSTILRSIESQGKLTAELASHINSARTLKWLEDVYLPFKPKKQTLATAARDKGLEPLASQILSGEVPAGELESRAAALIADEKGLASVDEVLQGVRHILAEQFSERPDLRGRLRRIMRRTGVLTSAQIEPSDKTDPSSRSVNPESVSEAGDEHPPLEPSEAVESESTDDASDELAASNLEPSTESPPVDEDSESIDELSSSGSLPLSPGPLAVAEASTSVAAPIAVESAEPVPSEMTTALAEAPHAEGDLSDAAQSDAAQTATAEAPAQVVADQSAASAATSAKNAATAKKLSRKRAAKERKRKLVEHAFKDYYSFREPISRLPPHRVLAINRGERAKVLRVRLECNNDDLYNEALRLLVPEGHPHASFLQDCVRDAMQRLVIPSLERELRRELTEEAEEHAVKVFAGNLRKLLLQPPVRGRRVLAIDPAFRSGCKLVALDEFGSVLRHCTIHVIGNEEQRNSARATLAEFIRPLHIGVVAIGNGAACRETEQLVSDVISNELKDLSIAYVIVNEAGASVYSTSQIGREELPQCDAMLRSAVSIGRRLLDPLSELVKINPANIGVGMYQHDVKAKHLRDSLDAVVNSCVNFVGVDVNTASPSLLSYVSGLNQLTARRLYEYRLEHGPFRSREQIKSVPGIGDATFVQAAGFLKISDGDHPLDSTWIHPESYDVACKVLERLSIPLADLIASNAGGTSNASGTSNANGTGAAPAAPPTDSQSASQEGSPTDETSEQAPQAVQEAEAPPQPELSGIDSASESATPEGASVGTLQADVVSEESPELALEPGSSTSGADTPSEPAAEMDDANAPEEQSASPVTEDLPDTSAAEVTQESVSESVPRSSLAERLANAAIGELSRELGIGELTLLDIVAALSRPGRDPRDDFSPPPLRTGIMKLDDLKPGMELQGTVLNVVDFGAFVDIGISDSALIHISKLADRFIRDPQEVVSVGDVLKVWVLGVDKERRRVSLTAIDPQAPARQRPPRERRQGRGRKPPPRPASTASVTPVNSSPPTRGAPSQGRKPAGRTFQKSKRPPGPPKKPKPVRPITPGMLTGKQPMRSFSDLMQYYEKKKDDPEPSP